jgi:ribosomal protein S27E
MDEVQPPQKPVNPLANYYRQPKIYVRLPSKGQFYPEGALDVSETDEYAVYAMTAKDELMLKTPDALMNGQSTVEVIKSCVPAIQNPWLMPNTDLDAVLIAIRVATYGEKMDINVKCPSCNHTNEYEIDLISYMQNLISFNYDNLVVVDPLEIYIRPYTYKEVTKTAIKALEQEKIFAIINDRTMSDEEKIEEFGLSFAKLTDLTVGLVTESIEKIVTPEGEVTDRKLIADFIKNAPKEIYSAVQERLDQLKKNLEIKAHDVKCSECSHTFTTTVTFDQSNFFAVRS